MAVELRDQIRRFYKEVFENRNLDAIDDLTTENVIEHEAPPGITLPAGRAGVKAVCKTYLDAFTDIHFDVHDAIEQGQMAATIYTFNGTHTGDLLGIPATGKRVAVDGVDWVRFEGPLCAEHWAVTDGLSMMQQLGVVPEM